MNRNQFGRGVTWLLLTGGLLLEPAQAQIPPAAAPPAVAPPATSVAEPATPVPPAADSAAPEALRLRATVSARRIRPERGTAFPQEVLAEAARELPLIDNDVYRSLHLIPGVDADDYNARFSLRGGEHNDLVTLVDGVPIHDPFHLQDFGGAISALGLDAVDSTTLLGDGFPAQYGDALGGVIEIRTRDPGPAHHGSVGFDLLNAHALARGPLGQGGYLVTARRGYIDLFLDAWAPDAGFRPAYHDLFAKVEQRPTSRDLLAFYGLWALDTNEIRREGEEPDLHSRYTNGTTWARWERKLADDGAIRAAVAYTRATRDRNEGVAGWDIRTIDSVLAQQDWSLPLGTPAAGILSWGGRLRYSRGDYRYHVRDFVDLSRPQLEAIDVTTRVAGLQTSLFLQHEAQPWDWLRTTAGLRVDQLQGVDGWNPGPRVAIAVTPAPHWTLRGAWGLYSQPVTPHELPVEAGDTDLRAAEQAEHRTVGLLWRPGPWLHLRLEGYWRRYEQLVGIRPNLGLEEQIFALPEAGQARGVELETRGWVADGRVGWLLGYALSRAVEWSATVEEHPRPTDRTHAVVGGLDLDLARYGRVSVVYRFHTGSPYTPAVGLEPDPDGGTPRIRWGRPGAARLPDFHSLDARWSKEWQWDRWSLQGYFQLMNATIHPNVQEYIHRVVQRDGVATIETSSEHYFPILPTLGLEGRW